MASNIGTKIVLGGEKDFRSAVSAINQQMKGLQSAAALTAEQYRENDKSLEALTHVTQDYEKEAEAHKKNIDKLNESLEAAKKLYGEDSQIVQKWQTELNKEQAALIKTERAIKDNNEQIAKMTSVTGKVKGAIDDWKKKVEDLKDKHETLYKGIKKVNDAAKEAASVGFDAIKTGAKAAGAALAAVTAGAIKLGKDVVESFGELEQNLGGSEAVFGKYASRIQSIGEEAYKNMGITQSEYLANANKMGALLQGSGLSQQESLEMTEKAMQRAADMASVMGIETSSALEAVTGAAKGNYTMMDNLGVKMDATTLEAYALSKGLAKVGAAKVDQEKVADAQTKVEKATLSVKSAQEKYNAAVEKYGKDSTQAKQASIGLQKAQVDLKAANDKLSTAMKPVSKETSKWWANASNAEKASVAMQYFFENTSKYANNFANEATGTISGSIGMLKASAESLVAGLGNADADIQNLAGNVIESFGYVAQNVSPIIQNIADSLPALAETAVKALDGDLLPTVMNSFTSLVQSLSEIAPKIIITLADGIIDNLDKILDSAIEVIEALTTGLLNEENITKIMNAGIGVVTKLVGFISENVDLLVDSAFDIIMALVNAFSDEESSKELIGGAIDIVVGVATGIIENTAELIPAALEMAGAIVTALIEYDWGKVGLQILKAIWNGMWSFEANVVHDPVFSAYAQAVQNERDLKAKPAPKTQNRHKTGLDYVPYDGYLAELHEGERVLTKAEAHTYSESGSDTVAEVRSLRRELAGMREDIRRYGMPVDIRNADQLGRKIGRAVHA